MFDFFYWKQSQKYLKVHLLNVWWIINQEQVHIQFLRTGWPQNSNKSDSPFPNYIVNHEGLNGIFGKFIILETIW